MMNVGMAITKYIVGILGYGKEKLVLCNLNYPN